ncbi:type 2 isopentenyl-diphosphate Delta-isomerase [Desulfofalx alkaliphila]|uniref:type 2 isopentenyl-diphosphate Delta-isomerase n=1 Tax=Desulfofalx alkaliphila TaxID=105483 RepID=UPI0004E1182F|nr:type 2 isopentenyl-diphosphate Delta-isomerase [Desulfofalx alkaliphila]
MRQLRKIDHINHALKEPDIPMAGFADIFILHNSIPELNWADLDTGSVFLNKSLSAPLIINAMTGGHPDLEHINGSLAEAARKAGIAMALGSQRAALEDETVIDTFKVVRRENPHGVVIANLNAGCTPLEAKKAVQMVQADAIQLHVNVPQELAMAEGDRDFKGVLAAISEVAQQLTVPVIVKEVGFGMSKETVAKLYRAGVKMVDISGRGGTNFISIEESRTSKERAKLEGVSNWGISTVISLVEAKSLNLPIHITASGGLRTAHDLAKSLALGADLVGISRPFLETLINEGKEALNRHLEELIRGLKKIMLMSGCKTIACLQQVPVIVTGSSAHWLKLRGIDLKKLAQRQG